MSIQKSKKILRTRKEIMIFLDIKSEDLFDRMVKQGLPVIVIGTQYYGHTESLEEYFKYRTMKRIGDSYDGAE